MGMGAAAGCPGRGVGTSPRLQICPRGSTRRPRVPLVPPGWGRSSPGPSTAVEPPSPAPSPSWSLHRTSLLGLPKGLLPRSEMLPVTERCARRPRPTVALLHLRLLTPGPPAGPRASPCHLPQQPPPHSPCGPRPPHVSPSPVSASGALRPFCSVSLLRGFYSRFETFLFAP